MVLLFNTRFITFASFVELILRCMKNNCPSVIIEKTQKKTKELQSETLTRKLHFKASWQIHGQPHGVLIRFLKGRRQI